MRCLETGATNCHIVFIGGFQMIAKITEIESAIDKMESMIKKLVEERDNARSEAERLKKQLDGKELEMLQLDEEIQKEAKRFEEEKETIKQTHADSEKKLDEIAARIRQILPLLPSQDGAPGNG